jgi:protein involved in polysaccharide export with SLBB domain
VVLVAVLLAMSAVSQAQRSLSIQSKKFSERTANGGEESPIAEPEGNLLLYPVPTSLEGPVDPETYILGPSDELSLVIRGPQTVVHPLRILPEGHVLLPNLGPYAAAGSTLGALEREVREVLGRYYRNVEMDVLLTKPRNFVVYVSGQVARPGAVELTAPSRVSHAVAAAGGVSEGGSVRLIEVRENGAVVYVSDLFRFLQDGDIGNNPILREGQTVHVPPRYMRAVTVGELRRGGAFEIRPGETAADLIHFSGGFSTTADTLHLIIERTNPGEAVKTIVFDSDSARSMPLRDLDVLVVPDLVSLHGIEPVEVIGGGGRDGSFQIAESEKLRDFLFRLWRFTTRYDVESAVIERNSPEGEPQYVYFNVRKVLEGDPLGGMVLHPGDTVSFPPREKQVFVTGEVVVPGAIPFLPGYTAERYIALAGGPTGAGTYGRVDIFDWNGNIRSGDRNSLVYRGETIVVKQKLSRTLGNLLLSAASLAGLALSIVAVSQ